MTDPDEPVFIINQALFENLAARDGEIEDGYKIHKVDLEARTLYFGGQKLKEVKIIHPFAGPTITFTKTTEAPRVAQWKRERNEYRRG